MYVYIYIYIYTHIYLYIKGLLTEREVCTVSVKYRTEVF